MSYTFIIDMFPKEPSYIEFCYPFFQGDEGLLTAEYTGEAHFGGFMSKADDEFKSSKGDSRKDFIEKLIKARL